MAARSTRPSHAQETDLVALAREWACVVERYAGERVKAAKRAREISDEFPKSEKDAWRAAYLTAHADVWIQRAIDARQEARDAERE